MRSENKSRTPWIVHVKDTLKTYREKDWLEKKRNLMRELGVDEADDVQSAISSNQSQEVPIVIDSDGEAEPVAPPTPAGATIAEIPPRPSPLPSPCSNASDVDLDSVFGDEEFLENLERVDKDLTKLNNEFDLFDIFETDDVTNKDPSSEMLELFPKIRKVCNSLGPIGNEFQQLHDTLTRSGQQFELDEKARRILITVFEKITLLLQHMPASQAPAYSELSRELKSLFDKMSISYNKFPKINVSSIADATMGQQASETMAFIKTTLRYFGYSEFSKEDVMTIYTSVKATHNQRL